MQGDYARVEQEREFERAHGFEETHGMGTTVGGFLARCAGGKSQNSCDDLGEMMKVPLNARDFRRPSMYMPNSLRFSGSTS